MSYLFLTAPEVLRYINLRESINYRERVFHKRTPLASRLELAADHEILVELAKFPNVLAFLELEREEYAGIA
jgi:hypothetical protein